MAKIKIFFLDSFCKQLFRKYKDCNNLPIYSEKQKKYYAEYKKTKQIRTQIEEMSSSIKDDGVFGKTYIVQIETLEAYFDLYNKLKEVPRSEIKISTPRSFCIYEKSTDFYQVE